MKFFISAFHKSQGVRHDLATEQQQKQKTVSALNACQ